LLNNHCRGRVEALFQMLKILTMTGVKWIGDTSIQEWEADLTWLDEPEANFLPIERKGLTRKLRCEINNAHQLEFFIASILAGVVQR
jgi:hypothetical protein